VGGASVEFFSADANSKANTGMYDDRFTFNVGTFFT
jgi:hypothetical protein